jgi:glycerol uptake facilitator protein
MATFLLVFVFIGIGNSVEETPSFDSARMEMTAMTIFLLGAALGGTTGWCLNPTRDLAPRIVHWLAPIHGKGTSQWSYAWVAFFGPIVGGALAGAVGALVFGKYSEAGYIQWAGVGLKYTFVSHFGFCSSRKVRDGSQ